MSALSGADIGHHGCPFDFCRYLMLLMLLSVAHSPLSHFGIDIPRNDFLRLMIIIISIFFSFSPENMNSAINWQPFTISLNFTHFMYFTFSFSNKERRPPMNVGLGRLPFYGRVFLSKVQASRYV